MAAKPNKLKATTAVKKSAKKTAKKSVKAPAKKAVKKAAPKAPQKAAPKKTVTKAVKKVAKKAVKKVAKKAVKKTVAKSPAVKKVVVKKAAKKTATKVVKKSAKKIAKKVVKKVAVKAIPAVAVAAAAPVAAPIVAATTVAAPKPAPTPAMPQISLKGLKGISGAKAARIAQIVAESFLPKVTEPAAEAKPVSSTPAPASHAANTDTLVASADASGEALNAAHKAAAVLFSKKAEDVVLMDLRNLSTVADYYLIATCTNEPQMRSMLGTVQRSLSREGIKSLRSEYMSGARWAVIDYGDLIVHLFEKQTRGYYSLERLWADAPATTLKAEDYALPDEADADEDGDL
jgi:ribosome silencing factor RsfS/YbeB/iojap